MRYPIAALFHVYPKLGIYIPGAVHPYLLTPMVRAGFRVWGCQRALRA